MQQAELDRVRAGAMSRPEPWRPPPTSAKLLLPVWGHRYVSQFLEVGLSTLLAPGNVPALAQTLPCEFQLLTSAADESYIRQHPAFLRLADVCRATTQSIDHLITAGNNSTTLTLAYVEAIRAAGPAMLDTCFFFLVSDYIVADGSLASVLARVRAGASAILVGNFQVAAEEAMPWLRERIGTATARTSLSARELMGWALGHLHPATVANTVNAASSHNAHTNRLFWRVDGDTLLGRFYLMHMIAVRPEIVDFKVGASWDYSFVPEMCPSGNLSVITDSDEYLVVEMQPRAHEAGFLRQGPLRPEALARSLGEWTTQQHRDNVAHSLVYHASDLPAGLRATIAAADEYVALVKHHLRRPAQPHYGHPYWRGAIATVQQGARGRLNPQALRRLLGTADRRGYWVERLRAVVIGYPPRVRPWHPRWADYRPMLRRLLPVFNDPARRLLHVSDAPTLFSVMLTEGGDRVACLQTTPLLQGSSENAQPVKHFDLCLVELDRLDAQTIGELVRRLRPFMKDGSSVLMLIREPPKDAQRFGSSLTETLRPLAPAVRLEEIRCVPASRLRAWSYQTFARLGADAHQRPWIGLPALALFAVPLALFTLLLNLFAAPRARGGAASSLHIVMRTTTPG